MSNRAQRRMEKFGNFSDTRWRYNDPSTKMLSLDRDIEDAFWESFHEYQRTVDEVDLLWSGVLPPKVQAYFLDEFNNLYPCPTFIGAII